MNTVKLSYRTDHVSCYIDAVSIRYHSANTWTTIFVSGTTNQYNNQCHHIRTLWNMIVGTWKVVVSS